MDDSRIPKRTFYLQLENGSRHHGGNSLKHNKDNLKNILNQCGIPSSDIESLAKDRTTWRTTCSDAVSCFKDMHVNSLKEKRVQRKEGPPVDSDFQCVTCGHDEIRRVDGSVPEQTRVKVMVSSPLAR